MEVYDLGMIAVLAAATLFGAYKGLAWQLASLGSIVLSYFVALQFRDPVAELISADPPWNVFLAMLILYGGTSLAVWITFRFVKQTIDRVKLKEFDRQFGAIFGFAKGVLLCVVVTLFAVTLLGEDLKQRIVHSYSGYYIAVLLDKTHVVIPEEIHEVLHPYIHELDENRELHDGSRSDPGPAYRSAERVRDDLYPSTGSNQDREPPVRYDQPPSDPRYPRYDEPRYPQYDRPYQ